MLAQVKKNLPEYYLIASVLFYWFFTANVLNPFAVGLLIILGFQVIYQRVAIGIAIAVIFIFLNLFMVLALVSELFEFTEYTSSFYKLLFVGTAYLGTNLFMSSIMMVKYPIRKTAPRIKNQVL